LRVAVIGSGPGGTAAAHALLGAGLDVDMLDVGHAPEPASDALVARIRAEVTPDQPPSEALRAELKHGPGAAPTRSLLQGVRAILSSGVDAERIEKRILGSPFVFDGADAGIPLASAQDAELSIPRSLSRGGLSNVWGSACYTWRADDYPHWPLDEAELAPHYAHAADLLGLVQHDDALAEAYPLIGAVSSAVERNPGSSPSHLIPHWASRRRELEAQGFVAGRSRMATRAPGASGDACRRCGLCVYGCAWDSIYSTRRTLPELERRGLRYHADSFVERFREDAEGIVLRLRSGNERREERYAAVFLAAGTLSSLRIAADSQGEHDRRVPMLDNDMMILPLFLTRAWVGGRFRSRFTLGEAALSLEPGRISERALHLQLYSFHEYFLAELGPVLAELPRALQRLAWSALNNLMVGFAYKAGSESRHITARVRPGDPIGTLEVEQQMHPDCLPSFARLHRHLLRTRRDLGFLPLSPLAKLTPLGFSGHIAGSLPMRRDPGPLETGLDGRLQGTRNVYVVDGAAFPDLPAQNLTYTIAANALRVADRFATKVAQ
jgi:choline dehydrogenase-like flavoprotein